LSSLPNSPTVLISQYTRWANSAIFALVLVSTVMFMFDEADCAYLGFLNGAVELISVTYLLLVEIPFYTMPDVVDSTLKSLFGFLYNPVGRLCYIVYLALILYGFSTFGIIMGVLMVVATLFNIYLYFKHPATRKAYHDLGSGNADTPYGSSAESSVAVAL